MASLASQMILMPSLGQGALSVVQERLESVGMSQDGHISFWLARWDFKLH